MLPNQFWKRVIFDIFQLSGHVNFWPSYMTLIYDPHIWSSYMTIIYDHHIWSSYIIIIYHHHIWSRKSIFCERARNSCGTPLFRCRVVNLERSNTVKTHTNRACKIVWRPVQVLPASNSPPGPLQDKTVWGNIYIYIYVYVLRRQPATAFWAASPLSFFAS